jgi:hypothetical protein
MLQRFLKFISRLAFGAELPPGRDWWTRPAFPYTEPKHVNITLFAIVARAILFFVTSAWFAFYPVYLAVIYMMRRNFFSYDFFTEGLFGLNTFLFVFLVFLILCSLTLWGFLIPLHGGRRHRAKTGDTKLVEWRFYTHSAIGISVLMHGLLLLNPDSWAVAITISAIGFCFALLAASLFDFSLMRFVANWKLPVFAMAATALVPAYNAEVTANMVSMALRMFNAGGGVQAAVVDRSDQTAVYSGKLLLLTPKNAFFREGERGMRLFLLSDNFDVVVNSAALTNGRKASRKPCTDHQPDTPAPPAIKAGPVTSSGREACPSRPPEQAAQTSPAGSASRSQL